MFIFISVFFSLQSQLDEVANAMVENKELLVYVQELEKKVEILSSFGSGGDNKSNTTAVIEEKILVNKQTQQFQVVYNDT
jgi:hypothetical protein